MRQAAYSYGGYADYFQEMERLEQFRGMTLRKASTSLLSGAGNNVGIHSKAVQVRTSDTGVRAPQTKQPFHPRPAQSATR